MRVVIIGGGTAGISTATKLRRLDEQCEIVVLDKNKEFAVSKCSMPYYISGLIKNADDLSGTDVESMAQQYKIKVMLEAKVYEIDKKQKILKIKDHDDISYDKLVIATGATQIRPDIEGVLSEDVFTVSSIEQLKYMKDFIEQNEVKDVVITGAGLIGIEMAEAFVKIGKNVTLIDMASHIIPSMDEDMAATLQNYLRAGGIKLYLRNRIIKFENKKAILASGETISYDLALIATGVRPDLELPIFSELEIGDANGLKVNEHLQTSDRDIYALGDIIESVNMITQKHTLMYSAAQAVKQSKVVAENLSGKKTKYGEIVGVMITPLFEYTIATAGCNEKVLRENNIDYQTMHLYGVSSSGFVEESEEMLFKILFADDGKILGVQGFGKKGIDKRIDTIANIMRKGGTIYDLEKAELGYTPAYGSAQDTVNNLGSLPSEVLNNGLQFAFYEDVDDKDSILIDVRPSPFFNHEHIQGAINISYLDMREHLDQIPKNKKVILYCNRGHNAYKAFCILRNYGFENIYVLSGGMSLYKQIEKNLNASSAV